MARTTNVVAAVALLAAALVGIAHAYYLPGVAAHNYKARRAHAPPHPHARSLTSPDARF